MPATAYYGMLPVNSKRYRAPGNGRASRETEVGPMGDKKALLTGDVKDFIAAMNPKRECKRKGSPMMRSQKNHHKRTV